MFASFKMNLVKHIMLWDLQHLLFFMYRYYEFAWLQTAMSVPLLMC